MKLTLITVRPYLIFLKRLPDKSTSLFVRLCDLCSLVSEKEDVI
jgi:hypothetical protein